MTEITPEKLARLPQWAQEEIRELRANLSSAEHQIRRLDEQNDRLQGLLEGKFSEKVTDTVLFSDDTDHPVALGNGAEIGFGDFFSVRYNAVQKALRVEGGRCIAVLPVDPDTVVIVEQP